MSLTIAKIYKQLRESDNPAQALRKFCYPGLSAADIQQKEKAGYSFYRGKVRDLLIRNDKIDIIHSDRLTAFDKFIAQVPCKGTMLAAITHYWLDKAKEVVPTHLLSKPSERVLAVEACKPVKVEVVVRGYLAGSMARAYQKGEREFCGERLVDGLTNYGKLPEVIITPTTKAAVFEHDENTTSEQLVKSGVVTEKDWLKIREMAIKIFKLGTEINQKRGWILVDTKYEFGHDRKGNLLLIDEVHTPDSSRFWLQETYNAKLKKGEAPDMLDKENVRRWLMSQGYQGEGEVPTAPADVLLSLGEVYLKVAETLIGEPLLAGELP